MASFERWFYSALIGGFSVTVYGPTWQFACAVISIGVIGTALRLFDERRAASLIERPQS